MRNKIRFLYLFNGKIEIEKKRNSKFVVGSGEQFSRKDPNV